MVRLLCRTDRGLRFGQWLFATGRAQNLRHALFVILARNVGWQEGIREGRALADIATAAWELDPGTHNIYIAN